jgi:hypothetical protein
MVIAEPENGNHTTAVMIIKAFTPSPVRHLTEALHHPALKDNDKASLRKASVTPWENFARPSRLFLLRFNSGL